MAKSTSIIKGTDQLEMDLALNNFNEQKTYSGAMGKAMDIQNLLFMKPGDFPSMPGMGINISQYRFEDIDKLTSGTLRDKIKKQITTYIKAVPLSDVKISMGKIRNLYVMFIEIVLFGDITAMYSVAQKDRKIVTFQLNLTENKIGRTAQK